MSTITNYATHIAKKPVIYLYPTSEEKVEVILNFKGQIIQSEPNYNSSWQVIAYPDGHLINQENKAIYPYLFWEGKFNRKLNWDFTQGFIIKGEETKEFLKNKLKEIGLISKEYNEFIKYWSPLLEKNRYNLIHFADGAEYTSLAELNIKPNPDSVLRVFMVYRPLKSLKNISLPQSQIFSDFKRAGFTAVEWGGMEDK